MLLSLMPVLTGQAFNAVLQGDRGQLVRLSLILLGVVVVSGCCDLSARLFPELVGKRVARDARAELYANLLGKSQTFHNRQRVGDIMARAANDMSELRNMVVPGLDIIFDSFTRLVVVIVIIALLSPQLLLPALRFLGLFGIGVPVH